MGTREESVMQLQLAQVAGMKISMLGQPSGHVWHFDVDEGGAVVFLLTLGAIDLKPIRPKFGEVVRVQPGIPHVVLAPGRYWACARSTTLGLQGRKR